MRFLVSVVTNRWSTKSTSTKRHVLRAFCGMLAFLDQNESCQYLPKIISIGERAKRASFEEDENSRDESLEMATDGNIHY